MKIEDFLKDGYLLTVVRDEEEDALFTAKLELAFDPFGQQWYSERTGVGETVANAIEGLLELLISDLEDEDEDDD